ncbi:uncharacterized protein RAG0_08206 [Rhynchosporium agropyri]|uniref:Uncharacterized protein n=1 Tax=Rhynchosporium agropyri TaxID=914238 RepID=A0A1E1KPK1_9HELO|nr:uncharacterized protein RAG0_08206 [Rhynchosporium agropyri]
MSTVSPTECTQLPAVHNKWFTLSVVVISVYNLLLSLKIYFSIINNNNYKYLGTIFKINRKYIIPTTKFPDNKSELYRSITKYKSTNTLRLYILIKYYSLRKLTLKADYPYTSRTNKSAALKIYSIAISSIIKFHKSTKVLYNLEVDIYALIISTIKTTKATKKATSISARKAKANLIATKATKTKAIKGLGLILIL